MADANNSLAWLPGLLLVAGVFFLVAAFFSDGPDRVGGIVFGVVSLAALGAILYRRRIDARKNAKDETTEEGNAN